MDGRDAGTPGAVPPAVVGRPALRTVPAWTDAPDLGGEDDLDAFPLPAEARMAELAAMVAASGQVEDAPARVTPEPVETVVPGAVALVAEPLPLAAPAPVADLVPDESIRRFHQELGLIPAAEGEAAGQDVPEADLQVTQTGDGGGSGDVPEGGSAPAGGGGRRRRRPLQVVDTPMTVFEHLDELRRRIMWAVLAFLLCTAATFPLINPIVNWARHGYNVQQIGPMEGIFAGMRIMLLGGLVLSSPVLIYQAIAYVLPALTPKERRLLYGYLPAGLLLFVAGTAFGLLVFEPVLLRMSAHFIANVTYDPSISKVVDFLMSYSLPFGLLFELPIVMSIVVRLGLLTPQAMIAGRRWAVIACVVVAEAFTPPMDLIVTPMMIFIPLYGLYEASIILAKRAYRQRLRDEAQAAAEV